MDEIERENVLATFKASLDSIFKEKLEQEKWKKQIDRFNARVNLGIVCPPDESVGGVTEDKIYMHVVIDKGTIIVEPGRLDDADFELSASFAVFFTVATGEASAVKALFSGALKATRMLKNLKKLLFMQKLLVLEKK
ncbi:MAG: SCP2 sterol-binding domain-containing protein [Candidatus Lokiarchaeota archaeon]|nr:SCP2 sterol-binding domain-containing protein [Candidatus Lokiarchaeota archaeon]